jgi:hypothetical protein
VIRLKNHALQINSFEPDITLFNSHQADLCSFFARLFRLNYKVDSIRGLLGFGPVARGCAMTVGDYRAVLALCFAAAATLSRSLHACADIFQLLIDLVNADQSAARIFIVKSDVNGDWQKHCESEDMNPTSSLVRRGCVTR